MAFHADLVPAYLGELIACPLRSHGHTGCHEGSEMDNCCPKKMSPVVHKALLLMTSVVPIILRCALLSALTISVGVACDPSGSKARDASVADASADAADASLPSKPRVILMIGDGMGRGQIAAATAQAGPLFMGTLPNRGELVTGSLSGITDSAAAATTMATGKRTFNTRIGIGPNEEHLETLVEVARRRGVRSGVVTTAYLSHATPASFTAHRMTRHDTVGIAEDQANLAADVMLGGGSAFLTRHYDGMRARGYSVVTTAQQLSQVDDDQVLGVFGPEHLDYVLDRSPETTQPTLPEMSMKALDLLDASDEGFFLMIEGARIDMASHLNDFERAVSETIAFDQTVKEVAAWAEAKGDVLLLVTADHECGGLELDPEVRWRWGDHTNARVDIFGMGPGSERFSDSLLDHRWVHAALLSQLTGDGFVEPEHVLVPDGNLNDLRHRVVEQTVESDFGVGFNQLDALWVDANDRGLAIGIEGIFQWDENAVNILIDVDYGASTGVSSMAAGLSDTEGTLDSIISSMNFTAPAAEGFGVDLVVGSWGGLEVHHESLLPEAGARALVPPLGLLSQFGWQVAATNFGEGVRAHGAASPEAGEGFEVFVPWSVLYPDLGGSVPVGAQIALAAVMVNDDGGYASNQALPPFASTAESPARNEVALPGVVAFTVDSDSDGVGDGDSTPVILD